MALSRESRAFRESHDLFVRAVDPDSIVSKLYSKKLLTPEEKERVTHPTLTRNRQLDDISGCLERRMSANTSAFHKLVQILFEEPALKAVGERMQACYDSQQSQGVQLSRSQNVPPSASSPTEMELESDDVMSRLPPIEKMECSTFCPAACYDSQQSPGVQLSRSQNVPPSASSPAEMELESDDVQSCLPPIPHSDSQLVLDKRKKLLGSGHLKSLPEDLKHIGKCNRVAYYGVIAAGSDFTELQIEVQRLGYDVTRLCSKSAVTLSKFQQACTTILRDLQATYEYFLDNFEELALETLAAVSETAGRMAEAAKKLHEDFENEAKQVEKVEERTIQERGKQASLMQKKEREKKELGHQLKQQQNILEEARRAEAQAEQHYHEYEMKEDAAIESLGEDGNLLITVINGITSMFFSTRLFGDGAKNKQKSWKAKRLEALQKRKQWESMRKKANQQLIDITISIERCQGEKKIAEAAANALHEAVHGLKAVASLMMQAATFWEYMQEHCNTLKEDKMRWILEKAMTLYDDAKRRKVWTSKPFRESAVNFYAGWVALDSVCGEYMLAIQKTEDELHEYIKKNPSYEDAERNVKRLANELQKELGDARKAIEEGSLRTDEEIQRLNDED